MNCALFALCCWQTDGNRVSTGTSHHPTMHQNHFFWVLDTMPWDWIPQAVKTFRCEPFLLHLSPEFKTPNVILTGTSKHGYNTRRMKCTNLVFVFWISNYFTKLFSSLRLVLEKRKKIKEFWRRAKMFPGQKGFSYNFRFNTNLPTTRLASPLLLSSSPVVRCHLHSNAPAAKRER